MTGPTWTTGPSSAVIWGRDRALLDSLAAALARVIGPKLFWFDIGDQGSQEGAPGSDKKSSSPKGKVHRLRPSEVALRDPTTILSHWILPLPTEGVSLERDEVQDFLRIPDAVQAVLGEVRPEEGPSSIVVSNVDRAAQLYSPVPGVFTPFIQLLNRRQFTLIFTNGGTPRENVWDFDVVLHIEPTTGGSSMCTCEKGRPESGFAPFQKGVRTPVETVRHLLAR